MTQRDYTWLEGLQNGKCQWPATSPFLCMYCKGANQGWSVDCMGIGAAEQSDHGPFSPAPLAAPWGPGDFLPRLNVRRPQPKQFAVDHTGPKTAICGHGVMNRWHSATVYNWSAKLHIFISLSFDDVLSHHLSCHEFCDSWENEDHSSYGIADSSILLPCAQRFECCTDQSMFSPHAITNSIGQHSIPLHAHIRRFTPSSTNCLIMKG